MSVASDCAKTLRLLYKSDLYRWRCSSLRNSVKSCVQAVVIIDMIFLYDIPLMNIRCLCFLSRLGGVGVWLGV